MQTVQTAQPVATRRPRREVVPSGVLGTLVFVCAELMFFAGLVSAFTISKAGALPGMWHLPTDPLLPAAATAVNTAALFASGVLVFVAWRLHVRGRPATTAMGWAVALGIAFVALQGREWVGLLAQGLTLRSSALGSFFYLIVGAHALHAVAALVALSIAWWRLRAGTLQPGFFLGAQTFWYFVVGVWPVIYGRVYF